MQWRILVLFCAVLGVSARGSLAFQQEKRSDGKSPAQVVKSPVVDGLQLVVSLPKTSRMGNPVVVDLKLRSERQDKAWIDHIVADLLGPIKVTLRAKNGPIVPYTLYGKSSYAPETDHDKLNRVTSPGHRNYIHAGGELDLSIPNLAAIYDLTLRRVYVFSVSVVIQTAGKNVTLDLGPVEFEIK